MIINPRGITWGWVFMIAVLLACDSFRPRDHDLADLQYEFAAENLDFYFIYRDKLPKDLYAFGSPEELYASVDERYTAYYDASGATALMLALSTKEGGIGIRIDSVATGYLIKDVFKNSPGEESGLKVHDTIVRISDQVVAGMQWNDVMVLLRGNSGTSVMLRVKRGAENFNIIVTRGEFISPSVFVDSINAVTASIIVTGFYNTTTDPNGSVGEFGDALDSTRWADYTIIDLRGNGGGYVHQCIAMISLLVTTGTPIINVRERREDSTGKSIEVATTYTANGPGTYAGRTLYLLVDNLTASASEIMVSCLMQYDGVKVIGDTTYGKACGQVLLAGPGSVMAKITSLVLTPADENMPSYNLVGIPPDIPVTSIDAFDMALNDIEAISVPAKRYVMGTRHYPARCDAPGGIRVPFAVVCGKE